MSSVAVGAVMPTRLRAMRDLGMVVFESGLLNLNIVGIRTKSPEPNKFRCTLELHYRDTLNGQAVWYTRSYPCTTLPGTTYLQSPMRKAGCAILLPGQYRGSHVIGKHRDKYAALIQQRPMQFVRDNTLDAIPDLTGPARSEIIGCNVHAADNNPFDAHDPKRTDIGPWSAGCQVLSGSADYRDYWGLVIKSARQYGPTFTYTLLQA